MKGINLWRLVYLAIPLTVAVFAAVLLANEWKNARSVHSVGCVPEAVRYTDGAEAGKAEAADYHLDSYTEGEGPAPVWWDPDEPMAAEWEDSNARQSDSNAVQRTDAGCPDWNVDSTLYGWDGHTSEAWELDLMARILYLEFLGCSRECCEAGADSILNLWGSGYFSNTLGGTLSATAENGALVYTTYGYVWEWDYDPDDLAWCLSLCEERFYNGPRWNCCFFQLYGYPEWAEPLYCLDGVYFSTFKE